MHGEQFADPNIVMFGKLALAVILGSVIGAERAVVARQAAGMRTFSLVALGACLFVVSGVFVNAEFVGIVSFDPTRMAAAVVQGIGFLGAGLIIFRGQSLHGVTTAAALWITAAIGVAVGLGMYQVSIFAALLTLVVFTGMWFVENRFKHWFESEQLHEEMTQPADRSF